MTVRAALALMIAERSENKYKLVRNRNTKLSMADQMRKAVRQQGHNKIRQLFTNLLRADTVFTHQVNIAPAIYVRTRVYIKDAARLW